MLVTLCIAVGLTNSLRKKYHFKFAQSQKGYMITLFTMWALVSSGTWPFLIIVYIIAKNSGKLDEMKNRDQDGSNPFYNSFSQSRYSGYHTAPGENNFKRANAKNISNPYNLPRRENGRKKIISKFNDRYNLTLTSQDIKNIAEATYMSIEWASEVYSMDRKYDSVYEWLGQGNSWLRVYLYVFNVQNISAVFNKQEELVFQSFNTIFSEMCTDDTLPTEVIIQNINSKYLTNFDETTFMLAINYMESKGKRYKYGAPILTRMESDIETLARKYSMPN